MEDSKVKCPLFWASIVFPTNQVYFLCCVLMLLGVGLAIWMITAMVNLSLEYSTDKPAGNSSAVEFLLYYAQESVDWNKGAFERASYVGPLPFAMQLLMAFFLLAVPAVILAWGIYTANTAERKRGFLFILFLGHLFWLIVPFLKGDSGECHSLSLDLHRAYIASQGHVLQLKSSEPKSEEDLLKIFAEIIGNITAYSSLAAWDTCRISLSSSRHPLIVANSNSPGSGTQDQDLQSLQYKITTYAYLAGWYNVHLFLMIVRALLAFWIFILANDSLPLTDTSSKPSAEKPVLANFVDFLNRKIAQIRSQEPAILPKTAPQRPDITPFYIMYCILGLAVVFSNRLLINLDCSDRASERASLEISALHLKQIFVSQFHFDSYPENLWSRERSQRLGEIEARWMTDNYACSSMSPSEVFTILDNFEVSFLRGLKAILTAGLTSAWPFLYILIVSMVIKGEGEGKFLVDNDIEKNH